MSGANVSIPYFAALLSWREPMSRASAQRLVGMLFATMPRLLGPTSRSMDRQNSTWCSEAGVVLGSAVAAGGAETLAANFILSRQQPQAATARVRVSRPANQISRSKPEEV